jgi:hypothetical protein
MCCTNCNSISTYQLNCIEQAAVDHMPSNSFHAHSTTEQARVQLDENEKEAQNEYNSVVDFGPGRGG